MRGVEFGVGVGWGDGNAVSKLFKGHQMNKRSICSGWFQKAEPWMMSRRDRKTELDSIPKSFDYQGSPHSG